MDWTRLGEQLQALLTAGERAQGAVAADAGVTSSYLTLLKRGGRNASVDTLERIVTAAGGRLVVDIVPAAGRVAEPEPLVQRLAAALSRLPADEAELEVHLLEMRAGLREVPGRVEEGTPAYSAGGKK